MAQVIRDVNPKSNRSADFLTGRAGGGRRSLRRGYFGKENGAAMQTARNEARAVVEARQ